MPQLIRSFVGVACVGAWLAVVPATHLAAQKANPHPAAPHAKPDALVLQEFQTRLKQYLDLRKDAAKKSPPPKETHDTPKIKAAQQVMAATIQSMRKDAKQGDIFTPAVSDRFRALLAPEFKGRK